MIKIDVLFLIFLKIVNDKSKVLQTVYLLKNLNFNHNFEPDL